ncbi:MAG: hypothetical protein ACMUJM_06455 [bacterium]
MEIRYDLVLDTGTLKHIFETRKVFKHLNMALKEEGYIIQMVPSNNYVDHGFYQFSPTLLADYYACNNYEIIIREHGMVKTSVKYECKWICNV